MKTLQFDPGREFAQALDRNDPLAAYRDEFTFLDQDMIYLDGNSLGRLPKQSVERIRKAVEEEWGDRLIRGWNSGWYDAPHRIGDKIAEILGAPSGSVIVSDSTTVNLYKLVRAAVEARPGRRKLISDELNFPSDLYVLQGVVTGSRSDLELEILPSNDEIEPDLERLYQAIDSNTLIVTLSHVSFKSGYLYFVPEIVERAHRQGAFVLLDLSHSAGVVPIQLMEWDVDLAIGCTYKYLNGGPGSPAFLYIRQDLQDQLRSPIWGWFGQKNPFRFSLQYEPVKGLTRFLVGTPPILSTIAIEPSVEMLLEVGIERIRDKSSRQTEYLISLFDHVLSPLGFKLGTPRDPDRRGSHVSVQHELGYPISQAMIHEKAVIPDFREPDNIRLGVSPLYLSYDELWQAIERIRLLLEEKLHLKYPQSRKRVT